MKLCMIGTGYVGLVSGTCFADIGHTVYCVDKDEAKIEKLNSSQSPIYEPGLDELIKENYKANRLFFTSNLSEAVNKSDIIFICVGTPNKRKSLSVDLKFVYQAVKDIKKVSKGKKIIVTKSTVPVGTGDQIEKILKNSKKFTVVSNPEFLREGEAIRDFKYPDRIVIGSNSSSIFKTMKNLYSPLINKGSKFFTTNRRGAELIKYAANAFLATKITYINEIANLCEKINVNVEDVSLGIGSDLRIGSRFLRAGPSYGGSCFPKDTKGLISIGEKEKVDLSIVKSVVKSNENRKKLILNKISQILKNKIKSKKVSILGVTFKPNTDDMRDSMSLKIIPYLIKKGAIVSYYDPTGEKKEFENLSNCNFYMNINDAVKKADLIILHTEWDEFKSLNFNSLIKKRKTSLYDLRNLLNTEDIKAKNLEYFSIGRPKIN
ncbi:MAG: UDP-glucose dehydrogenase family protein [Pelagibacteraceae bacterium]